VDEAREAPAPNDGSLDTLSDSARYARLDADLARIEVPTERWFTGWAWTFAWATVGNAGFAAATPTYQQRVLAVVTGTTSALALGAMAVQPNTLIGERDRMAKMDASTPLGQYERRKHAEYVLHGVAAEEAYWRSPIPHILGIAVAGASAAVLIEGYKLTAFGILQGSLGFALAELQIWTRPTLATAAWHRYAHDVSAQKPSEQGPDQLDMFSVSLVAAPTGMGLKGTF
jgi:hypothetical protein